MIKYSDNDLREKELTLGFQSRGDRVHHDRKGMVADSEGMAAGSHCACTRKAEKSKSGQAIHPQSLPPVMYFIYLPKAS